MKALIFDVDGTLWDSRRPVAIAWDRVIEKETGKPLGLNEENITYLFGKPMDEICACVFPELPKEKQLEIGNKCFAYENEYLAEDPGTLFPGVEETLEKLAASYPLYIVSNCQSGYIEVFLESKGLGHCFKGHLCFGDTHLSKGQTIRRLMKEHGLTDVVYIGDTQGDANACAEARIPFVFAEYGFGECEKADGRIAAFSELLTMFPKTGTEGTPARREL
ncbi:MAG: HAD family hydrolase [Eubacteriales bacterium]|nr:HAD family hydrolase [Eubacteriales bacterium]